MSKANSAIRHYLASIVEASTRSAFDNIESGNNAANEKDRQKRFVRDIRNTVGKGVSEEEQEVDEDEDDLFSDEPKKKKKSPEKDAKKSSDSPPEKKKAASAEPAPSPEPEEKPDAKQQLPKRISKNLPAAEDVSLDMVVDRLNIMRSGKSLRDEEVSIQLKHYFEGLSSPERLAMLAYLTGITEIVAGGVEGDEAKTPADAPDADSSQGSEKKKQTDPTTKSLPRGEDVQPHAQATAGEDITPPIVVGTKQKTESIRRIIRKML